MPKEKCPLCGNEEAHYKNIDFGRKKLFDCQECKYFVIGPGLAERFKVLSKGSSKISQAFREELALISIKSKNISNDSVLFIYITNSDEILTEEQPRENWS